MHNDAPIECDQGHPISKCPRSSETPTNPPSPPRAVGDCDVGDKGIANQRSSIDCAACICFSRSEYIGDWNSSCYSSNCKDKEVRVSGHVCLGSVVYHICALDGAVRNPTICVSRPSGGDHFRSIPTRPKISQLASRWRSSSTKS